MNVTEASPFDETATIIRCSECDTQYTIKQDAIVTSCPKCGTIEDLRLKPGSEGLECKD